MEVRFRLNRQEWPVFPAWRFERCATEKVVHRHVPKPIGHIAYFLARSFLQTTILVVPRMGGIERCSAVEAVQPARSERWEVMFPRKLLFGVLLALLLIGSTSAALAGEVSTAQKPAAHWDVFSNLRDLIARVGAIFSPAAPPRTNAPKAPPHAPFSPRCLSSAGDPNGQCT